MAEHSDQGTGKHPHKSSEEPYQHTKESSSHKGSGSGHESSSHKGSGSGHESSSDSSSHSSSHSSGSGKGGHESPQERHAHQEEGAHKRAAEIKKEHGH